MKITSKTFVVPFLNWLCNRYFLSTYIFLNPDALQSIYILLRYFWTHLLYNIKVLFTLVIIRECL